MKRLLFIVCFLLIPALAFAKQNLTEFNLQLHFVNATKDTSNIDLENNAIIPWVEEAQKQFNVKPSLNLTYTIERKKKLNGLDLSELEFKSYAEFGKFMDDNFDNYARTETEGHLTFLVGNKLCWNDGKKCWGGWANFPHDVNPFDRKKGIWLKETGDKYVLTHELGHFFSLKHTFEPYVGFSKQCNKEFGRKNVLNPEISHCNSCKGKIILLGDSYFCENGASNVMDYCSSVVPDGSGGYTTGTETLNVCQQERTAKQRQQYLTKDGKVNYIKLAGLRGAGACSQDSECKSNEFCTAGILDLKRNVCKEKKPLGSTCTNKRQCSSDRCNLGKCAKADECQADADCGSGNYCGDPIAGQRTCKTKLANGALCTKGDQCQAGRCKSGFCSAAGSVSMNESCRFNDECRAGKCNAPIGGATKGTCVCKRDSDCDAGQYCDAGIDTKVNKCRSKLKKGEKCGKAFSVGNDHKCKSGKCSGAPKYKCK